MRVKTPPPLAPKAPSRMELLAEPGAHAPRSSLNASVELSLSRKRIGNRTLCPGQVLSRALRTAGAIPRALRSLIITAAARRAGGLMPSMARKPEVAPSWPR
jgi:hypothetical protein